MDIEKVIKIVFLIVACLFSIYTSVMAIVKGLSKRKTTKALTQVEQENDLYDYMVNQTIQVESFSKIIANSMTKEELSVYKRNTVINNMTLYAKANGYLWYDSDVWGGKLTTYIENANASAGKVKAQKPVVNAGR